MVMVLVWEPTPTSRRGLYGYRPLATITADNDVPTWETASPWRSRERRACPWITVTVAVMVWEAGVASFAPVAVNCSDFVLTEKVRWTQVAVWCRMIRCLRRRKRQVTATITLTGPLWMNEQSREIAASFPRLRIRHGLGRGL